MTQNPSTETETLPRRSRRGRFGWWMLFTNGLALVFLIYAVLAFSSRSMPLPDWVSTRAEAEINAAIAPGSVSVGKVTFAVGRDGLPRVALQDVTMRDATGAEVVRLNQMSANMAARGILSGTLAPREIQLEGAQITVRRDRDGAFSVAFEGAERGDARSAADIVSGVEALLAMPPLTFLETVDARDVTISLEDARSGRLWQASNARLAVAAREDVLSASLLSEVFNGTDDLAEVQISVDIDRNGSGISVAAQMTGAASGDVALQSPALSFLSVIDAGIDGSLRANLARDGTLLDVAASLDIGAGAIQPQENATYAFDRARAYLDFDPDNQRITFSELSMTSETLSVLGEGHAYLRDLEGEWPSRLVGQVQLSDVRFSGDGLLEEEAVFESGAVDANLTLSPFRLDFGQIVLEKMADPDPRRVRARGSVSATDSGWDAAIDFEAAELAPEEVLALWPLEAAEGTRVWVAENVLSGRLRDVNGGVRRKAGLTPDIALSFDVHDAEVRFLEHFPPITGGFGRASFEENAFTLYLARGEVLPPSGGSIDLTGSVFRVADVRPNIPRAHISLKTESTLRAALEVLNNKPFEILEKSGLASDVADARAESLSDISFLLTKVVYKEDVDFQTTGKLVDVSSQSLLPGLPLSSESLDVEIDADTLVIAGLGQVGTIPISARWEQDLAENAVGASRLEADVPISTETLADFGVSLENVGVNGEAQGRLEIDLVRSGPGDLQLTSDLVGLSANVPEIGLSKASNTEGLLSVTGQLGSDLVITEIALSTPGLDATGTPVLSEDGTIAGVSLDRVRVGRWFDGQVLIQSAGATPELTILGGSVDLRERDQSGSSGDAGAPVEVALDELILSDTITLRPFSAVLPGRGQEGRFDARVNGRSPVNGRLIPQATGTALQIRSQSGGDVLSDAGILRGATGGELVATLVPTDQAGGFDGQMSITNTSLRDAPAAARLLDAASIVGLIDELNGPGIQFDSVEARFWLGREQFRLYRAAAVGPSLGISLNGTYDLARKTMHMQGVVSPFYLINGIGSVFTRRGEGLFGMNFEVSGNATNPTVSVNPLSILTPGMFREIFRTAPPTAAPSQ